MGFSGNPLSREAGERKRNNSLRKVLGLEAYPDYLPPVSSFQLLASSFNIII